MKLVVLALVLFAAVAQGEVISSPFTKHVINFAEDFKKFIASNPDGPSKDVYKTAYSKYMAAKKALGAMRPTGRPFRPHKERAQHNFANWALTNQWRKARAALRRYATEKVQQAKLAANSKEADETEVLSSKFASHPNLFRQHFDGLLASRPTGRPGLEQLEKMMKEKYNQAKHALSALKPDKHGEDSKAWKDAKQQLKDHKEDLEDKLDDWEDEMDEMDVMNSEYGQHINSFKSHFNQQYAMRPTGRPRPMTFMKDLEAKYRELKDLLKSKRPAKEASKAEKDLYDDAKDLLKDHYEDAEKKVMTWKKAYNKQQQSVADADETEVLSQHFDGLLASRPTGRPGLEQLENMLKEKYNEAKHALSALKPDKHGEDSKAWKDARQQLKDHKDDIEDKLDDWEDEMDEIDVMNSDYGQHINSFKSHFNQQYAMRPTGRPRSMTFMKDLEAKYKELKDLLKAKKPAKEASKAEKDLYDDAKDLLKDHYEDAEEKVMAWKKAYSKQSDADETEMLASPYGAHPSTFRQHFDNIFANRPTGRPDFKLYNKMMDDKYHTAKAALQASRPSKAKTDDRKAYNKAYKQLKDHKEEIEDKFDEWKDDLKKQAVLNSVYGKHVIGFRDHANNKFDVLPTGRPEIRLFYKNLEKVYKEHQASLRAEKPDHDDKMENIYEDARDQLKDHWDDAQDKVKAWSNQVRKSYQKQRQQLWEDAKAARIGY